MEASTAAASLLPRLPLLLALAVQAAVGPADPETGRPGAVTVGAVGAVLAAHDVDVTLAGSPESMARQHAVAVASALTFVGNLDEMEHLAEEGDLVAIDGGPDYEVMDWVFPYGVPEVRTLVERLAAQYRAACGETMVVTSLTRPYSEQPPNAHQLSVHPAGMAVDLRIPRNPECLRFLEQRLLMKEAAGLLDITRERAPPHYHIAVFPEPYARWVAMQTPLEPLRPADRERRRVPPWLGLAVVLLVVATGVGAAWAALRRRAGAG